MRGFPLVFVSAIFTLFKFEDTVFHHFLISGFGPGLFFKNEIDGEHEKSESDKVVHFQWFRLKKNHGKKRKRHKGNHFLQHLVLPNIKRTAVADVAHFNCGLCAMYSKKAMPKLIIMMPNTLPKRPAVAKNSH